MALQNDTSRIQYNGNNSTTSSYAIPFVFFENAHIKCVVTSSAGVDTTLALGSGYNVTGAANANGGSLTTTAAVPTSSKVTIFREVPATQTTSYQEGGDFPAASHERALDKLTMIAQQTKRLADRALKVPETQNNPNDLPNSGSGNRVLASNNGTITWEENRQLPQYPGGNTQKLLSAPGGGFAPSWQDAPSIAVGPITSTGSNTPRFIADRFSDYINILDYGADPTGATDSWLAIQRAIAAGSNHPTLQQNASTLNAPANTEVQLSASADTFFWGGKNFPKLFFVGGQRPVLFPNGTYSVSRPIVVGSKTHLIGLGTVVLQPTVGSKGNFNLIESAHIWMSRTQCNDNIPFQLFSGFDHELKIENLTLQAVNWADPYPTGVTQTPKLAFYHMPIFNSGPGSTFNVRANATAGNNYFTTTGGFPNIYPGAKYKFVGHNTVYTYVSRSGNDIYVTPNIANTVTDRHVQLGLPANNGIMVNGGENSYIRNCYSGLFAGAGIAVLGGTPAQVVQNCMNNGNDIAFWMEAGTNTLIQPSGDGNNVFLRTGYLSHVNTTMIECKVEGQRQPEPWYITNGWPYPLATSNRSAIEYGCMSAAGPTHLTIMGGTFNIAYATLVNDQYGGTHPFISAWRDVEFPRLTLQGTKQLGYRRTFYKCIFINNGNTDLEYKRGKLDDYEDNVTIGGRTVLSWYDDTSFPHVNGVRLLTRSNGNDGGYVGLHGDQGSGVLDNTASYTRSGTTATFTYYAANGTTPADHGLQVGDWILVRYPAGFNDANRLNPDTSGGNGTFTGASVVKSVPSGSTFTITVLNSGGTSGSGVLLLVSKTFNFHAVENGQHIIQMPMDLGENAARVGLGIRDKQNRLLSGLRVATANEGEWWASKQFGLGGTIDAPSARILVGADAPAASAPNGSLYLRTNGDSSTTLYVRAAGSWKPLASYDP
jgi:hypothetical protein